MVSAARVRSPGRAPAAPQASCDGWLAARLLTGVLPGALRLSSSFMLWYTATMYAAEGTRDPRADDTQDPESRETLWLVSMLAARAEMSLLAMILSMRLEEPEPITETGTMPSSCSGSIISMRQSPQPPHGQRQTEAQL